MAVAMGALAMGGASLADGFMSSRRSRRETRRMRRLMQRQLDFAQEQWQHYRDTYGDVEQQMVADAMHGVRGDFAGVTSRARADVEDAFRGERDSQQREMMSLGIDPSSGRYQSADRRAGLEMATTSAMAQNQAREQERRRAEDQTWQRRSQMGTHGARMMAHGADGVQRAMGNSAQMHRQNAQHHGELANNMFSNAGMMTMYGLDQWSGDGGAANSPIATSNTPTNNQSPSGFNLSSVNAPSSSGGGSSTANTNWGGQPSGKFNYGAGQGLDFNRTYSMR